MLVCRRCKECGKKYKRKINAWNIRNGKMPKYCGKSCAGRAIRRAQMEEEKKQA